MTVERLLDPRGRPRLGRFAGSLQDADGRHDTTPDAFGRQRGRLARQLTYKQFQYFGGMSRDLIFGCALIDLGYASSVFWYVVDARTGEREEQVVRLPGRLGLSMSASPVSGESRHRSRGLQIVQRYQDAPRSKQLVLEAGDRLFIDAVMPESGFEPMSLCTRAGYQGWVYANKTAGLPLTGTLRWRGETHDLARLGAMGHHDFSCGYMRRETWWNWACLSGRAVDADGHAADLGFNLSCGVNETTWSENCLWLDGRLLPVSGMVFHFPEDDVLQPWTLASLDGEVSLQFTPLGMHRETLRALVLSGHFRQIFGHFSGTLRAGARHFVIDRLPGFVEDQFVRW